MDLLEKRVKSRFSQNIVYLPNPKDFDSYVGAIREALISPLLTVSSRQRYVESVERILGNHSVQNYLERLYEETRDPLEGLKIFVQPGFSCLLSCRLMP